MWRRHLASALALIALAVVVSLVLGDAVWLALAPLSLALFAIGVAIRLAEADRGSQERDASRPRIN